VRAARKREREQDGRRSVTHLVKALLEVDDEAAAVNVVVEHGAVDDLAARARARRPVQLERHVEVLRHALDAHIPEAGRLDEAQAGRVGGHGHAHPVVAGERLQLPAGEQPRLVSVVSGTVLTCLDNSTGSRPAVGQKVVSGENRLLPYCGAFTLSAESMAILLITENFSA
jgi:hypothetical protein